MRVTVETPKWSFIKYRRTGAGYKVDSLSPLPTPFNYGYVEGTKAEDGMPQDAIVLGRRRRQGEEVDARLLGRVLFFDDGRADDKLVTSDGGNITSADVWRIRLFFSAYVVFKTLQGLLRKGRLVRCRFGGFKEAYV